MNLFSRRGQGSIEFIVLVGFMFLLLLTTFGLVQTKMVSVTREKNYGMLEQVANLVQLEITLAESVDGNYYRIFSLPDRIGGNNYTINITGPADLSIWIDNYGYVLFLNKNISGTIGKGDNFIKKENDNISILNLGFSTGSPSSLPSTDTIPPAVALSFPSNGATLNGTITIIAISSDNVAVGSVEFFVDGASIGRDDSAPYSISYDLLALPDGSHTLNATANDTSGNKNSTNITFVVDNSPLYVIVNSITGHLALEGQRYFVRGANYIGGLHVSSYVHQGVPEIFNEWQYYNNFDETGINQEFAFMRDNLGVNTVRILTPSLNEFAPYPTNYGWPQWFQADGSINGIYLDRLNKTIQIAKNNGFRVQLELLHNVQNEVDVPSTSLASPGSPEEAFYFKYLDSVIPAFKNEPTIMSYEIGNELLVNWPINGAARSGWYEEIVLGFAARMINRTRQLDPNHLITTGEAVCQNQSNPDCTSLWWTPSAEFAVINDVDNQNGGVPYSLYDKSDYISPHFYFVNASDFAAAANSITALSSDKPVVMGEFGYFYPGVLNINYTQYDRSVLAPLQYKYINSSINATLIYDLDGGMLWTPLPILPLEDGNFSEVVGGYSGNLPNTTIFAWSGGVRDPANDRLVQWYGAIHPEVFNYTQGGLKPMPAATLFNKSFCIPAPAWGSCS